MKKYQLIAAALCIACAAVRAQGSRADDAVTIFMQERGAAVSPSMYGIFFEEITFSGFGKKFRYEFSPYSYTILRIKAKISR